MKYYFCRQDEKNFCVPACLQSIIHRRFGEILEQKDIFDKFEKAEQGVMLNENNLNKFLERYNLKSKYYHPKMSMYDIDDILIEALSINTDIIFAFYSEILYHKKRELNHAALVTRAHYTNFSIHDPAYNAIAGIEFRDVENITQNDGKSGFHLVNTPERHKRLRYLF